jgi:hypothetical protein
MLSGASLVITSSMTAADAVTAQSTWVHPGKGGKLEYKTTPSGDRIMDFSYAGYMGGGVALPAVPARRTVQPSGADDTAAIQSALDEVAGIKLENGFRGAVLLGPGTFTCSNTISISASGVVLRGSGPEGAKQTTIKLTGKPHLGVAIRNPGGGRRRDSAENQDIKSAETTIADAYVPSGTKSFSVVDASAFAVGDTIQIRRPVTPTWIKFMHMDDLVRNGKAETWLRVGNTTDTERRIAAISGKTIALDIPISDSFAAKYLNPPGVKVLKFRPPQRISQSGIESLHIQSPPQQINHTQAHFQALRISGEDCWVSDVICEETMNSVAVSGRRITLQRVAVNRKTPHQGSSKPAEFAPNGSQVLLDRCTGVGDNIWYSATGAGIAGPIVLLNCSFTGNGRIESHQRWTTGVLYDNCRVTGGGIDFRNRGEMGSGHGWTMGWGVAWNCVAESFVIQDPPGAMNWMIGCVGKSQPMPRPFDREPNLPEGTKDSHGMHVAPQSLYLAQLAERLGPQALKNIGY